MEKDTRYCRNCAFIRQNRNCQIYCQKDGEFIMINDVCKHWELDSRLKDEPNEKM